MVTGFLEAAAAYQTIQPIVSFQIQLIKDIYKTINCIRELAKEYKIRFETHAKLVDEVDSQFLLLSKLIEGLKQLSDGNTLDDANRESIDRKLSLLGFDLQGIEARLRTLGQNMIVEDGNPKTTMRKLKRFYAGVDFVSAGRKELKSALEISSNWSSSITLEVTFLLVMDNHRAIRENHAGAVGTSDDKRDWYEPFKPLNLTITEAVSNTPIMQLVKRITAAREKAFAIYDLDIGDLRKQIASFSKNDTNILEYNIDIENGGPTLAFKGSSKNYPHCIMDHERHFVGSTQVGLDIEFEMWLRETMVLAAILSADQRGGEGEESNESENAVQELSILPVCVGVIGTIKNNFAILKYVFQLPPSTDPNIRSLRRALTDPESQNHPIDDRYSLALHLAQSLFLIHSAGIIHKQIRPESVFLANKLEDHEKDKYPTRLGRAFLFGYGQTRSGAGVTRSEPFDWSHSRSRIYRPPRHLTDFDEKRNDRYRMIDDIYGLGICLLEIGLWTSLFKLDDGSYVEDPEVFRFERERMPYEEQTKLLRKAQNELPRKSGIRFMRIIVSCLDCFNKEISGGFGELGVDASPAKLLRKYEELVLNKLKELVGHE